ncbi:MAG: MMPL family transporter [Rudaea sp.]
MKTHTRAAAIALWWLAVVVAGLGVQRTLVVDNDLRSFLPPAQNDDQKLLLDELGDGPASRLLLLAISGAPPARLAALSRGLTQRLRGDVRFVDVFNGDESLTGLDSALLPYRYLLSPTLDHTHLDTTFLHDQLQQRLEDLGSPAADQLGDLLPRDPTLETLVLAQRWTPRHAPTVRDGVWFSTAGEALLIASTRASGLDIAAQTQAMVAVRAAFAALLDKGAAQLALSGAGVIGAQVAATTRAQAERLSLIGTLGFALLLLLAYRSFTVLALVALPLVSGALAGLVAIVVQFGSVHGITLAFGFTLLGVAQEYPIRLFSHRRADADAQAGLRSVWPLLRLAIVSACIAYLAFFAAGVPGLRQLAVFTITGLLVAGAATRWLLPALLPDRCVDVAAQSWLQRAQARLVALPRPHALPWLLLLVGLFVLWRAPPPLWQNDLAALAPASPAQLALENRLRTALGAPDVRYVLVLHAGSADAVLRLAERISSQVDKWISAHVVDDVELPTRWLPSIETQHMRQAALPDRASLASALDAALVDLPFKPGLFAPFVHDVETARTLPPLTPEAFMDSPLGTRLRALLVQRDGRWYGLATLDGVHDPAAMSGIGAQTGGAVRLLDLKSAAENLIARYRARILFALGVALVLLVVAVAVALRDGRRAWHVLAPMLLATLLAIAVLRACGVPLSLFHLVAITLAAGLGLHYALFFERPVEDTNEACRTLHATLVCVASAVLVFGLLATSTVPVLRAIGATVALGVAFHFILSTQMAARREHA